MRTGILALVVAFSSFAQSNVTTITVDNTVSQKGVKRFGINLSFLSFWDSGQMMRNLVHRNPGFEPMLYQSVMRCASGSAMTCTDDHVYSAWPSGFWNGASFELIRNGNQVRSGTVTAFVAPAAPTGGTYIFNSSGISPVSGDLIILRKQWTDGATNGWSVQSTGGGSASSETADLPPGTAGQQCARLNALTAGASTTLASYFDSTAGRTFVQVVGPHRISFWAKGAGGNNQLTVALNRSGGPNAVYQTVGLSSSWKQYNIDFTGVDSGSAVGTVQLLFTAQGASVLLDDVSLTQLNSDSTNQTAFRDPVVKALKDLRPGILRYWGSQLGDSLDNQLATVGARQPSGYSAFTTKHEDIVYSLHEFLQLCQTVGAEPWYVFPTVSTPLEASNLIEYLAGPATSTYGAKRAALGQALPWTSVFSKIHLEFGNESWNSVFKGGVIEYPDAYGSRAQTLFAAMRANPSFIASRFNLIIGGQHDYVQRTVAMNAATNNHDTLALAPYISSRVESYFTLEDLYGPLFAEPQYEVRQGQLRQEYDLIRASSRPVPLAVYETNMGTVSGAISQDVLDKYTPSLGAGVAMASHMLTMLQELGIRDQNLYALPQYQYLRTDGKQVKIWGAVVDMGVTDRKRPQYLALQLLNEALAGDMLTTSLSANAPKWNQPLVNGIQLSQANYIQAFGFAQATKKALVLINLHRTASLPVNFAGDQAPRGLLTYKSLGGASPMLTNEDQQNVSISTQTLSNFNPSTAFNLPPHSVNVLLWDGGTTVPTPTDPPVTLQISNLKVSGITNWGATISWTTNLPARSVLRYGTDATYGRTQTVSNSPGTQHSTLIWGLSNNVTYNAQAVATDTAGNTVTSANFTFKTLDQVPPSIGNIRASFGTTFQGNRTVTTTAITWDTDEESDSQVEYGPTLSYGSASLLNSTLTRSHSVLLVDLVPGTYHYRVRSRDAAGNLATSVDVTVVVPQSTATAGPAFDLIDLAVWNVTGTSATISWSTNRPVTTVVEYGTGPGLTSPALAQNPSPVHGHQITLSGLVPGTRYYFRASSADSTGGRGFSSVRSFDTPDTQAPIISNVKVVVLSSNSASVTWTTNKPADGQVEYGSTPSHGMWSAWDSAHKTEHQAVLQWLGPDVNYFRIRSRDTAGNLAVTESTPFSMR